MLLSQDARDLYHKAAQRWAILDAWLDDSANAASAAKVRTPINTFRAHWQEVDKGLLSDAAEISGAFNELEAAETYAIGVGFPKPDDYHAPRPHDDVVSTNPTVQIAQKVDDTVCKDPKSPLCATTTPGDKAWCQRLGVPDLICDKDGLANWFLWTLGLTGVAALGGLVYVQYRLAKFAAPIAIGAYAPELLPAYQALQRGDKAALEEHVVKAAQAEGARRRGVAA